MISRLCEYKFIKIQKSVNEENNIQNSTEQAVNYTDLLSAVFPVTKECHCGHVADKYRKRNFKNALGQEVTRIFYRCRNCWSRIHEDFIPEMDKKTTVNVMDLLRQNSR